MAGCRPEAIGDVMTFKTKAVEVRKEKRIKWGDLYGKKKMNEFW